MLPFNLPSTLEQWKPYLEPCSVNLQQVMIPPSYSIKIEALRTFNPSSSHAKVVAQKSRPEEREA